jgi:hypothetical protein
MQRVVRRLAPGHIRDRARRIRSRLGRAFKPRKRCRVPPWRAGFVCRRPRIAPGRRRPVSRVRCGSASGACSRGEFGLSRSTQRGLHSLINCCGKVLIHHRARFRPCRPADCLRPTRRLRRQMMLPTVTHQLPASAAGRNVGVEALATKLVIYRCFAHGARPYGQI